MAGYLMINGYLDMTSDNNKVFELVKMLLPQLLSVLKEHPTADLNLFIAKSPAPILVTLQKCLLLALPREQQLRIKFANYHMGAKAYTVLDDPDWIKNLQQKTL